MDIKKIKTIGIIFVIIIIFGMMLYSSISAKVEYKNTLDNYEKVIEQLKSEKEFKIDDLFIEPITNSFDYNRYRPLYQDMIKHILTNIVNDKIKFAKIKASIRLIDDKKIDIYIGNNIISNVDKTDFCIKYSYEKIDDYSIKLIDKVNVKNADVPFQKSMN